jgi:hypothetical protein
VIGTSKFLGRTPEIGGEIVYKGKNWSSRFLTFLLMDLSEEVVYSLQETKLASRAVWGKQTYRDGEVGCTTHGEIHHLVRFHHDVFDCHVLLFLRRRKEFGMRENGDGRWTRRESE